MKLPSFQFYPADWRKDPGVQSLTFHQRGVWLEILCLMHESPRRGYLLLPNGNTMSDDALSRIIGLDKQNLTTTLTAILECGVADRDPATEALMNRRMIRDEALRQTRSKCGKMGGNPNLLNQKPKQKPTTRLKQKPTPSSSSSSSSSDDNFSPSRGRAGSEAEVVEFVKGLGFPESDGSYLWNSWESNGWKRGKEPIKDWKSAVRAWRDGGYLPSQKGGKNNGRSKQRGAGSNPESTAGDSIKHL